MEAIGPPVSRSRFFRKALNQEDHLLALLVIPVRGKQQMGMCFVLKISPTLVWPTHRPVYINRKMSPHLAKQHWGRRKESNDSVTFCPNQMGLFLHPFSQERKES